MAWFAFERPGLEPAGWSLHVQCAWRLDGPRGPEAASGDLWETADPDDPRPIEAPDGYDHIPNLRDRNADRLFQSVGAKPKILFFKSVAAQDSGDVVLNLSGSYALRLFVNHTRGEAWRLLPRPPGRHFVVPPEP